MPATLYLMWRKAVLRWKMTTDHPAEKLGHKVMNSLDWTVQAFVNGRLSTEALLQSDGMESTVKVLDAKAGWIQEDESKLLLRKALFNVERGRNESLRQFTTRRLALRARLRKENRCFRCKKKGHWKAECQEKQHNKDGTSPSAFSGLTFLHSVEEDSNWTAAAWRGQLVGCIPRFRVVAAWTTRSPGVPPGHLIVDSAAGQALIGETACVRWERKLNDVGLRGVQVHTKMVTPKGMERAARSTRSMMMPTMIDGLSGVLQYTVVEEDIPGLLPLSFQEKQGALINLGTNEHHLPRLISRVFRCFAKCFRCHVERGYRIRQP